MDGGGRLVELIAGFWSEAEESLAALESRDQTRLNAAITAVDTVWDQRIFDHAETFGGAEIGDATVLSAAILAKLLDVEYVGLASATGGSLPPSGRAALDELLQQACQDALSTFSDELLGPEKVEDLLVYGRPILLDSPIPVGAVLVADREPMSGAQEHLLREYLRHLDTRMNAAQQLSALRRENSELRLELRRVAEPPEVPAPARVRRKGAIPEDFGEQVAKLAKRIPRLLLFDIELATLHFDEFCSNLELVTDQYLAILEDASSLYLDIPSAIDAKSDDAKAEPYRRLFEIARLLRPATRAIFQCDADELEIYAANRGAPTFADLTRAAKQRTDDETVARILDLMNDQGEEEEVDALYARQHPYEFRVANLGEVFSLLALYRTVMNRLPERLDDVKAKILAALPKYQAARAFLFAYDRFEDLPLRGEKRSAPEHSTSLLLRRESAPSFGVLLWAYRDG